jgi:diadenylate cyclase
MSARTRLIGRAYAGMGLTDTRRGRIVQEIIGIFQRFTLVSIIDIGLVALVFYALLRLFQGTQAVSLLRGILVVALVISLATSLFPLSAFSWLLRNSLPMILVAIPVIFQPELRRALERLGRTTPLIGRIAPTDLTQRVIYEVVRAVEILARTKTGALIVLEGETGLEDYIESGERIDGMASTRLLTTIFFPNTALHDGAVIVRGERLIAAGCVLPLTSRILPDSSLGTRHRAAVGITEQTDALVIVVSEETGIISIARSGRIVRRLDDQRLGRILQAFYRPRKLFGGTDSG